MLFELNFNYRDRNKTNGSNWIFFRLNLLTYNVSTNIAITNLNIINKKNAKLSNGKRNFKEIRTM